MMATQDCFVRLFLCDVHASPLVERGVLFGNPSILVKWVRVFGFVIACKTSPEGLELRIDDGSAVVSLRVPRKIIDLGETLPSTLCGQFMECLGSICVNDGDRTVLAKSLRVLIDPLAEMVKPLETLKLYKEKYGVKFNSKIPMPKISDPKSPAPAPHTDIDQMNSDPLDDEPFLVSPVISQHFLAGLSQFSQPVESEALGAFASEVEAAISDSMEGISHQDLEQRLLHISRTDLAQTVEQLMANGHIYDAGGLLYVV